MKVSIFGYYGQGNIGDEALLKALIVGLKSVFPSVEIAAYSGKPEETEKYHDSIKAFNFFPMTFLGAIKGLIKNNRKDMMMSFLNIIKSDVVIVGGGGLFFDTQDTNKWMLNYLKIIRVSLFLRKSVNVIGVSIGPLHHQHSRDEIGRVFSRVNLITVRDIMSKDELVACGVNENKIYVLPDLVFSLSQSELLESERYNRKYLQEPSKNVIRIAIAPATHNESNPDWVRQYKSLINNLILDYKCELIFLPFQQSSSLNDLKAINRLTDGVGVEDRKKISIASSKGIGEIYSAIQHADFIIAEKLHATIMAIIAMKPFVSISYMPKVEGVLLDAGLGDRLIKMDEFLAGTGYNIISKKLESIKDYDLDFSEKVKELRGQSKTTFELIEKFNHN